MPAHRTLEESFLLKADRRGADECWPWLGSRNHKGYGYITRRTNGGMRYFKATRIAWSIFHGRAFPPNLLACHSCDNPWCVNPTHIWPGTNAENMADKIAKCRQNYSGLQRGRGASPNHCARGHEYTPENTMITARGFRVCRTCVRANARATYRIRKERAA